MIQAPPAADPELERVVRAIVDGLAPERVQLFGSRARGDAHEDSDYDIIVVLDTPLGDDERTGLVREAIRGHPIAVDLCVYTPAEFRRKRDDVGTLVYAAEHEGRVLYERAGAALSAPPAPRVREERRAPPESLADWLARVESDFDAMETQARARRRHPDVICLHAHAAVEKLLKAVVIAGHTPPPRTHVLRDLLPLCPVALHGSRRVTGACTFLDSLWPRTRYPGKRMPSSTEAKDAVAAARAIRVAVQGLSLLWG